MTDLELIEKCGDTLVLVSSDSDLRVVVDWWGKCDARQWDVMVYRFDGNKCRESVDKEFGKFEDAWAYVRRVFEREE